MDGSAIPPCTSLYSEPKTRASKPSWSLISSKRPFWSAASGAKPPFLGISAYGGKANLPIIRLDLW